MKRYAVAFVLLVVAAALPLALGEYYVNLASQILIAAIFAASLNLLVGYGGLPSLGHAAWLGLAAYVWAWTTLRVPYPIGYFAKGMDGRFDDMNTGWKGKGLWSTFSDRAATHIEGGKGQQSKVVHFQLRPDPLAK